MPSEPMTLGQVATHFQIQLWQVRAIYQRGILPEPPRFTRFRIVDRSELPTIRAALITGGYLKPEAARCARRGRTPRAVRRGVPDQRG